MEVKMLLVGALVLLFGQLSQLKEVDEHWEDFKKNFERNFEPEEEMKRKNIFKENFFKIQQHNAEAEKGVHSYFLKITPFADMTNEEFKRRMMREYKMEDMKPASGQQIPPEAIADDVPKYIEWQQWCNSEVMDQGSCGNCWAFAATWTLECRNLVKNGFFVPLSVQNVLDCAEPVIDTENSCSGGSAMCVFAQFSNPQKGVNSKNQYPAYDEKKHECRFDRYKYGFYSEGLVRVGLNEGALTRAIATTGPVVVTINFTPFTIQHYGSGIYSDPKCDDSRYTHLLMISGYTPEYFRLKNSFGPKWGEKGYIRIKRGMNLCGINTWANYPE